MGRDRLDQLLSALRAEAQQRAKPAPELAALLRELACLYERPENTFRQDPVANVRELIHSQLERQWTVLQLAKRCAMSRAVFARRFKALYDMTPLAYLQQQRMARAAALLAVTDLTLSEIAARTGYNSEFAFSRAFKRQQGISPGAYRRRYVQSSVRMLASAA